MVRVQVRPEQVAILIGVLMILEGALIIPYYSFIGEVMVVAGFVLVVASYIQLQTHQNLLAKAKTRKKR